MHDRKYKTRNQPKPTQTNPETNLKMSKRYKNCMIWDVHMSARWLIYNTKEEWGGPSQWMCFSIIGGVGAARKRAGAPASRCLLYTSPSPRD